MRNLPKCTGFLEADALIYQAKQTARTLRRQAVSEFWDGVFAQSDKATRALARLGSRIKMHRHFRAQAAHELFPVKDV